MKFYVELLDSAYEMNIPEERMRLRADLFAFGFFEYNEHKMYWKLLEQSEVGPDLAIDFAKAVQLFNEVKLRKRPIN